MRALVTGVAGFCGPHLVSRLRREGDIEIAGLDRVAGSPPRIHLDRYFQADVTDSAAVAAAVKAFRPDWFFHLAGLSGSSAPVASIYHANITGTIHALESIRAHALGCRVLLVGSSAEYGPMEASALPVTEAMPCRPVGAYGVSKYAATLIGMEYARQFGLNVVVARPSNIVGPGVPSSLVVGALIARAKQALSSSQTVVKVGDFDSQRDFIAVADVVDAYVRLLQAGLRGEIFNICSGQAHSIRSIAEMLLANSSVPITLEFDPDLLPPSSIRCLYGSYQKAARAIGFQPLTSLGEALKAAWCSGMEVGVVCE